MKTKTFKAGDHEITYTVEPLKAARESEREIARASAADDGGESYADALIAYAMRVVTAIDGEPVDFEYDVSPREAVLLGGLVMRDRSAGKLRLPMPAASQDFTNS